MRTTSPNRRLRLAAHVRACEIDGQVILLDLKANRYIGIGGMTSSRLADRVDGWPARSAEGAQAIDSAFTSVGEDNSLGSSDRLTESLTSRGLLTADNTPRPSDVRKSPPVAEATASLDLGDIGASSAVGPRQVGTFLCSAIRAAWWLRSRSLHSIASVVASRHERHQQRNPQSHRRAGADPAGFAQMMQCAVVYERLRPLLLTANEKCLFDSLALMSFLAAEGLFPNWIIGVKTGPFGAHSWVQAGPTVLNDQHDHVRRFRPILVV